MLKKILLPPLIALSLTCSSSLFGCSTNTPVDPNIENLREVLSSELPTVSGARTRISQFKNKIVMLHFFASWCPHCNSEAPSLRALQESFAGSDFEIVGISLDQDPFEAKRFAAQFNLNFPIILDTQGELKNFFSISSLPTTIFLDRNLSPVTLRDPQTGEQTAKLTGARKWHTEKPTEMIAAMIEAK